jgi:hypothetical protein
LVRFVRFVVVAHGLFLVRKSILTQTREKDISAEAEHDPFPSCQKFSHRLNKLMCHQMIT